MERLHAASLGIGGERHGFGGLSCGEDLTVDLLYDCGFSHEEVLGSIMAEAVRRGGRMHTDASCTWALRTIVFGGRARAHE